MKLRATKSGVHGRLIREGDIFEDRELVQLGGFVPDYFEPIGAPEDIDTPKFVAPKTKAECILWFQARGEEVDENLTAKQLKEMVIDAQKRDYVEGLTERDPLID